MVRFSLFNSHTHNHRHKKQGPPSFETLLKMLQSTSPTPCTDPSPQETEKTNYDLLDERGHTIIASSIQQHRKSEEIISSRSVRNNSEDLHVRHLRRGRSLGSELDEEGGMFGENIGKNCAGEGFSCDGSSDERDHRETQLNQEQEISVCESPQVGSDQLNNESIFSGGDPQDLGKVELENRGKPISFESAGGPGSCTPPTPPVLARSASMPSFGSISPVSRQCAPFLNSPSRHRSFVSLPVSDVKMKGVSTHYASAEEQGDPDMYPSDNHRRKSDEYFDYNCGLSKDWIVPENEKNIEGFSSDLLDLFQSKDFKLKRIAEWVTDLQICGPVDEITEGSASDMQLRKGYRMLDGIEFESAKPGAMISPGMEAAKRYISSLNPSASSAQLANHGLAFIPFLGAFVSLKVLNLSGNCIERITAGALPRGLHMLNLSRNRISTIEGLRELTRLRLLDLSYNKIVRIGHGLASCSSMKELYLAGNKISEVEGLHRLLKLTILDLRFNKISTSKGVGQLAANYNSLQAISLEGNPAQKNVGDEQLKKHLLGLLPHLVYYNRKPVKSSKETGDRSVRLGMSSHHLDRSTRSDHKSSRRGSSHGAAAVKQTAQLADSPRRSRGRHVQMPPSATKKTHHQQHQVDFSGKISSLRSHVSMPKSQSMGSLAAH